MKKRPLWCVNLCSGPILVPGWINVDCGGTPDLAINLEEQLLPFPDKSIDCLACISAINYFTFERGREIIQDVYRVLRPGGVARFASQDLQLLAHHYVEKNRTFWFEKLPTGKDRYPGKTFAEKFNNFFNAFPAYGHGCKVVYDYETLAHMFTDCGFELVESAVFGKSRLPDITLLDNRPEQMFFLEAVKLPEFENFAPDAELNIAETLLAQGHKEQAWQRLLRIAFASPWHTRSMTLLLSTCVDVTRPADALQILEMHRTALGGQPNTLDAMEKPLRAQLELQKQCCLSPENLVSLDQRENTILNDTQHIQACIDWLCSAQNATNDGGVASSYYPLQQRWDGSYAETTGYIISTFLTWSAYTRDNALRERAIAMGDWEIAIQHPNGGTGEPYGMFAPQPRSFNTGQVLLGWMALYVATHEQRFLEAALKAGLWLTTNIDRYGRFVRYVYKGPRAYKIRIAWALFALERLTGEARLGHAARRICSWTMAQARPSGWFTANSLTEPERPWTHLISYALVGLVEILHLAPADCPLHEIQKVLEKAARGLCNAQEGRAPLRQPAFPLPAQPGTYTERWESNDLWTCLTGNAQSAFFLQRLAPLTSMNVTETSAAIIDDIKRVHYIDGIDDPCLYGGLAGSWPLGGAYCPWMLPNWAPKFFADALLLRLGSDTSHFYIG